MISSYLICKFLGFIMFSIASLLTAHDRNQQLSEFKKDQKSSEKCDNSISSDIEKTDSEKSDSINDLIFPTSSSSNQNINTSIPDISSMFWMPQSLPTNEPNSLLNSNIEQYLMMTRRSCKFFSFKRKKENHLRRKTFLIFLWMSFY